MSAPMLGGAGATSSSLPPSSWAKAMPVRKKSAEKQKGSAFYG